MNMFSSLTEGLCLMAKGGKKYGSKLECGFYFSKDFDCRQHPIILTITALTKIPYMVCHEYPAVINALVTSSGNREETIVLIV